MSGFLGTFHKIAYFNRKFGYIFLRFSDFLIFLVANVWISRNFHKIAYFNRKFGYICLRFSDCFMPLDFSVVFCGV